MIFFEDAIFLDEPVPQKVKTGAKGNISNKVDGGVSKQPKCGWVGGQENASYNLPAPASPCPWSQRFGMQNNDAHNSVDSVNVTQRVASTRNMSWGGMKTRIPCPGISEQSKCLENQLFILFQHFAAYYTTLYCYTMLTVNRSNQQALHHGVSSMTATTVPVL